MLNSYWIILAISDAATAIPENPNLYKTICAVLCFSLESIHQFLFLFDRFLDETNHNKFGN